MKTRLLKSKRNLSKIQKPIDVAVAYGDGIGPEIMRATLRILNRAGASINPLEIELGENVFLSGNTSGIDTNAWERIKIAQVILKAPITTPQGKGFKSLNVTLRKSLGLFANIRPVRSLSPFVPTHFPEMDVVIIRENEEDLYAGIEHRQTQDVYQCLKLITRPGSEKIIRYAFEYARVYERKRVTCMVKDNIMKITDGLFHKVFKEVAKDYPEIESDVQIIDIGSAKLANDPESYDVIVTPNLYGDIISDIAAEIGGSVGMCGSVNYGLEATMFEAIHGSAPDIAGQGIANPSGLLNAAISMLVHIGQPKIADKIKNAWLLTLEQGYHTPDIYDPVKSKKSVGTQEFAEKVISNLGKSPKILKPSSFGNVKGEIVIPKYIRKVQKKSLVGVDIFLDWPGSEPEVLGDALAECESYGLNLKMITNRGVKVYPKGQKETFCTDHWRCRFIGAKDKKAAGQTKSEEVTFEKIIALLALLNQKEFDVIKTENLYEFDGQRGYSLGQGE